MTGPTPDTPRTPRMSPGKDWLPIAISGFVLAALIFLAFFYEPPGGTIDDGQPNIYEESAPVPELDPAILARAHDQTRAERLVTDVEPLKHLLEKSLSVTPAVAHKLGMPQDAVTVARVRSQPDHFRGHYLWFKGELEYISKPNPGHPVPSYSYYEGRLRTAAGEPVLFAFSVPPPADLEIGDWVRMEGFFLKLRDAHLPVSLDQAPILIGPELFAAYPDWKAVERLDPAVLARVRDGQWAGEGSSFTGGEDMDTMLADSQDVPLWHLASYALSRPNDAASWQQVPAFVEKAQFDQFRRGETAKGTPMRILGTFVRARILPARSNPLGIEAWTEAWVQVRDLGGKTIPVWIPDRIASDWKRNQTAVCRGYFFKRYRYPTLDGAVRWTPLFVAAELDRFELPAMPLSTAATIGFASVVCGVGLVLFVLARRDRRRSRRHEAELTERRRRRRADAVSPPACPS